MADLFNLQPVAPDPLQQVTEAGDESVLFHPRDADLPVAQLHRLPAHLLHQHALRLHNNNTAPDEHVFARPTPDMSPLKSNVDTCTRWTDVAICVRSTQPTPNQINMDSGIWKDGKYDNIKLRQGR